ncbi:hypothetical protein ACOBR2_18855 [Telmatobacter bradus]|uniref:hypothetical protein n=1 Tax=Telmatobacter bradus TaxID=474953 RepID=UPI003B43D3CD
MFNTCALKTSLPVLILLLIVAQLDLACSFGWPLPLLTLLHLTPAPNDTLRGMCSGLGCCIDVLVLFQLARRWGKRALAKNDAPLHG